MMSVGEQISVCLLTYNHVDIIDSTLETIRNQTLAGYEIVVSDDCSTDGTWERIVAAAAVDDRIRPVRTPRNLGMAGNANFGMSQTTRPYVALLHHDDLYRSDLLEKWAGVLTRHPDIAFVFNPYAVFGSDVRQEYPMPGERIAGSWLLDHYLFALWGCVIHGTAMIRRSAWDQVGGIREQFGLLADIDLWMRLAMIAPVGYVADPLVTVRHDRPEYYPEMYKGGTWSWSRQRYLYEIHATNLRAYLDLSTIGGRLRWWRFRIRLTADSAKWLLYAVVRRRRDMIDSSAEGVTAWELWPSSVLRSALKILVGSRSHA